MALTQPRVQSLDTLGGNETGLMRRNLNPNAWRTYALEVLEWKDDPVVREPDSGHCYRRFPAFCSVASQCQGESTYQGRNRQETMMARSDIRRLHRDESRERPSKMFRSPAPKNTNPDDRTGAWRGNAGPGLGATKIPEAPRYPHPTNR